MRYPNRKGGEIPSAGVGVNIFVLRIFIFGARSLVYLNVKQNVIQASDEGSFIQFRQDPTLQSPLHTFVKRKV